MKCPFPRRYVEDERELELDRLEIKLCACPHCGRSGTLIGHGWLRGYSEHGQERVLRGRRLYCSNRRRRPGCGRTLSVLVASAIRDFIVRAPTLFRFAEEVVGGGTLAAAWRAAAGGAFSASSGYRLWRRLRNAQSALRSRLCREAAPPGCAHPEPMGALVAHFRLVLPNASSAFSEFQARLQHGLFERAA